MRRLLAGVIVAIGVSVSAWAAEPASGPAARAVTRPASGPTTAASRPGPTSRAARDASRRDELRRKDEAARLSGSLASIAPDADTAESEIDTISRRLSGESITYTVDAELPAQLREIEPRLNENDSLLSPAPAMENLRSLDAEWTQDARQLREWQEDLGRRNDQLRDANAKLIAIIDQWRLRSRDVRDANLVLESDQQISPDTINQFLDRARAVRRSAQTLYDKLYWEQGRSRSLQIQLTSWQIRVSNALQNVRDAERKAQNRLLAQDSRPLWSEVAQPQGGVANVAEQGRNSFSNQWQVLGNYVVRQRPRFLLHAAGVLALAAGLIWLRRQTRQWVGSDPTLGAATRVFQTPIATAITVTMILTPWVYLAAPRLFWGVLGTAALIPTIMVLRPLIEKPLRPLLYGLAGATFVNLLLSIVAALPLVYRLLFLCQMGGAAIFFIWFLRSGRRLAADPSKPQMRRAAVFGARLGLALTVVAFSANVFGFVSLSRLIGGALITSAYLGVLLDTSVHVLDALLLGASHIRPLALLGMVQRHRPLLLRRLHVLLSILAVWLWGYFTLDALSIRSTITAQAEAVWAWPKDVDEVFRAPTAKTATVVEAPPPVIEDDGSDPTTQPSTQPVAAVAPVAPVEKKPADVPAADSKGSASTLSNTLYVGGVLSFCLTLAAAFYLSRFIAFLLDEDVYPRMHLARGLPYAISTLLRYVILAIGFTLAIAKLGYNDLTQLTILVSAFGVGLGFGMQNIVNNFVSGLILLFERPVQVGDVIELDNFVGVVSRIGIRASVVRTALLSEIIVPNGRLISDRVINWTLSNRQRGVELSVTFAAGPDPQEVIRLLCATAKAHPLVAAYPPPQAFFSDFSGGGIKFDVRVWTNRFEDWTQVRSELAVAVNAMVVKENLTLK